MANAKTQDAGQRQSLETSLSQLKVTVTTIDNLSQDGLSEISALAGMALKLMETEAAYLWPESIAQVLNAIKGRSEDLENLIGCEAERVGCNYIDEALARRREARFAADSLRQSGEVAA